MRENTGVGAARTEGGILLFAGTSEGRKLSERLAAADVGHTVCVATAYGEVVLEENPIVQVRQGRMDRDEIAALVREGGYRTVVDATHPYAEAVTRNIQSAVEACNRSGRTVPAVRYLRLRRAEASQIEEDGGTARITYCKTQEECAAMLSHREGNILLTTGSKALAVYSAVEGLRERLYVRVLPDAAGIACCAEQGICGKQIIAMQGPFTTEMNEAMIRQYEIACLVTKESGMAGGYGEKLRAAARTGIELFVIGHPDEPEGLSYAEVCAALEQISGKRLSAEGQMEIVLAGAGMGQLAGMTEEVRTAVREADLLFGASRLIDAVTPKGEKRCAYQAAQILPALYQIQEAYPYAETVKIVVLFSGDSGFYSGCRPLYAALQQEIQAGRLQAKVRILPGISAVSYLAAQIGETYQDARVCSIHGSQTRQQKAAILRDAVGHSAKTYLLTAGVQDVKLLGELLVEEGMADCRIVTGCQLSDPAQQICTRTPQECAALQEEGMYTCLIYSPYAASRRLTHGMPDTWWSRGRVPMTKEEVREISICKLRLQAGAVVYDIGSGTGSIAVEIAALSSDLQVYAIERKEEALLLMRENIGRAGLTNVTVVPAQAPEGLKGLPAASHALIGGSGGRLREILAALRQCNPRMRVVVNAVTLETVSVLQELMASPETAEQELLQVQVNRADAVGAYHLMRAENPVWICAFRFADDPGKEAAEQSAGKEREI